MRPIFFLTTLVLSSCAIAAPAELDERQLDLPDLESMSPTTGALESILPGDGTFIASSEAATVPAASSSSGTGISSTTSTKSSTKSATTGTDDVLSNTGCKSVTLIFARGTGEGATMGTVVGPGLASNLRTATGDAAVQGVDYPADSAGNIEQGASGGPTMAALTVKALQQCPNTIIILAGYSQGAMVVHNAAANSTTSGKVTAVATFGDPMNGKDFSNVPAANVVRYCGSQDSVCNGSGEKNTTGSHISYGDNVKEAAYHLAAIVDGTA